MAMARKEHIDIQQNVLNLKYIWNGMTFAMSEKHRKWHRMQWGLVILTQEATKIMTRAHKLLRLLQCNFQLPRLGIYHFVDFWILWGDLLF